MAKSKSGGGITSRNLRNVGVRTGNSKGKPANPAAVAQLGTRVGDHITDRRKSSGYRGEPFYLGDSLNTKVPFGNECALHSAGNKAGVGSDRTLYGKSGSQGMHGKPNPGSTAPAQPRYILSQFGDDYIRKGRFSPKAQ